MTETLLDVAAQPTQAVTALAERRHDVGTDPLLDLLAAWADEADAQPVVEVLPFRRFDVRPGSRARPVLQYGRTVAALTVAITVCRPSGIAAAVNGDPLRTAAASWSAKLTTFGARATRVRRRRLGHQSGRCSGLPTDGRDAPPAAAA